MAQWAALVSAATAALSALGAFHATDQKLGRYSNTVEKVQTVLMWWARLSDVDKANPTHIQELVHDCEELFARERVRVSCVVLCLSLRSYSCE